MRNSRLSLPALDSRWGTTASWLAIFVTITLAASPAGAVEWQDERSVVPSDGAASDGFGFEVAAASGVVFVGAPWEDHSTSPESANEGAVYVLELGASGPVEVQKLVSSDDASAGAFGYRIAVDGQRAVVTAPGGGCTAAFVFEQNGGTWSETRKLVPQLVPCPSTQYGYGNAVALRGDTVAVGAYAENDKGAVYVFVDVAGDWTEQQRIVAPDAATGDSFGAAVALLDDDLFVAAPTEDGDQENIGAVYVFRRSAGAWTFAQKIRSAIPVPNTQYGATLSVEGDVLAVANPEYSSPTGVTSQGAVYVYDRGASDWGSEQLLVGDDSEASDHFGAAIALVGGRLVVGAPRDGHSDAPARGSVYTFTREGADWAQRDKLILAAPADTRKFGQALGMTGTDLVVGAEQDTDLPVGTAFWFAAAAPAPAADAGTPEIDAGTPAIDAGVQPDAGPPGASDGCGCSAGRATHTPATPVAATALLALPFLWLARRRRHERTSGPPPRP